MEALAQRLEGTCFTSFPLGHGPRMDPDQRGQLPPGQAGIDPGCFEPCRKGGRRNSKELVSEELDDFRHEADIRCEVPVLPGVHRRGVGTEKLRDIRLPEAQIEATRSDVIAECLQLGRIGGRPLFLST
jgi:hypothetical protein